ncbi:MAG: single-stranded-DNA-specific exonuclease RecJ [Acidimicrobiales bacterium]|nr:single-stranded-DNA-specific exonuclease RecJ [Hyphomonadaceae bacterium]RZV40588.1 MAG: single-stranded-DNA-specific exonuclease RecJ [Acidimicrobiales bacterium]
MSQDDPHFLFDGQSSVRGKKWTFRANDESKIEDLVRAGYTQTVSRLLSGRDVMPEDSEHFLNPTLRDYLPDPSSLVDMDKAAKRIVDAIENSESVTVFADYDVDGGTSAAQLVRWGRALGAEFSIYVPDRIKEGYGPSVDAFHLIKQRGADLVITVDCGAAAHDALFAAAEIDLPIIVIDHHLMVGDIPPAHALVNPNRPDDESGLGHLAAAGVTFVALVALNREARKRGIENLPDLKRFLDLTALGTICDVVPLKGLNRAFVTQGLKVLDSYPNPGLEMLGRVAKSSGKASTYHGGFILGPRINAGGRIGQADMGAQLLASDDMQKIEEYAFELDRINTQRKALQERVLVEAIEKAERLPADHSVTIVAMDGWHAGIIGIVAGRLKDRFDRPAIVIGINEDGVGKGSGRSISGVNLGEAIQKAKESGILEAGGGHEMAAGLTINPEKLEEFQSFIEEMLAQDVEEARKKQSYKVDALLTPAAATPELIEQIEHVGPYGSNNPEPVFVFPDMRVSYAQRLNGGHVRCAFEDHAGIRVSGIAFRADENGIADVLLSPNPPIMNIAGRLKQDTWNGRTKIDLQIADILVNA